jgi:hypothetical protein
MAPVDRPPAGVVGAGVELELEVGTELRGVTVAELATSSAVKAFHYSDWLAFAYFHSRRNQITMLVFLHA